jgi:hypothetical protein
VESQVVFYRLSRKIVSNQQAIPEEARQVMYYSLAIGHHVGVMDCLSEVMTVPAEVYKQCLERMSQDEPRRKLEGAMLWDEIEINCGHADQLLPALRDLRSVMNDADSHWVGRLIECLQDIKAEPALYLMVKMRA